VQDSKKLFDAEEFLPFNPTVQTIRNFILVLSSFYPQDCSSDSSLASGN